MAPASPAAMECEPEGEVLLMAEREDVGVREMAFAAIVDRHARLMFRVAFSLLRNTQDAEDAVQEAFLKLYRGEAWRQMDDEKAYLARTVWRVALDRLPKLKVQPIEQTTEPFVSQDAGVYVAGADLGAAARPAHGHLFAGRCGA